MVFAGEVLSVGELLTRALAEPAPAPASDVGVRHTAAANAADAARLVRSGQMLADGWRFGVLQTLDDYTSTLRRGGVALAAQVFTDPPEPTGYAELDAAFAALADFLAERDGWAAPAWVFAPARCTAEWFPAVPAAFHADAARESPRAFRDRGVWITARSLLRA